MHCMRHGHSRKRRAGVGLCSLCTSEDGLYLIVITTAESGTLDYLVGRNSLACHRELSRDMSFMGDSLSTDTLCCVGLGINVEEEVMRFDVVGSHTTVSEIVSHGHWNDS